jgi:hypothetical protein
MEKLRQVNDALFKTAIEAIDSLAPNIEHVILQTGGKVRPHIDKVWNRLMALNSTAKSPSILP